MDTQTFLIWLCLSNLVCPFLILLDYLLQHRRQLTPVPGACMSCFRSTMASGAALTHHMLRGLSHRSAKGAQEEGELL